ncbi:response regulator transcription factor [Conexibacter sp. SYSU D00693]|uniref:response regulator transcription factor n=1 Tax=Conexibacter sp. SYSU D00693 TaxID=2812560 RepID=UPI00196AE3EA|nr:response regulator transcription factor [Conexibacter sp. SYSU D00693]
MTDIDVAGMGIAARQEETAAAATQVPTVAFVGGGTLLREALGWWLRASGAFDVTASCATLADLAVLDVAPVDVTLVDATQLPDPSAVEALERLPSGRPKLVLLAPTLDSALVRVAALCRASGVVLESDSAPDVLDALRHVCSGRVVYPAGWQELAAETDVRSPVALLSQRQLEVLRLVAEGRRNDEIAAELVVSQNTVKFHIHEIYAKLGVRNRVQAAQMLLAEDGK